MGLCAPALSASACRSVAGAPNYPTFRRQRNAVHCVQAREVLCVQQERMMHSYLSNLVFTGYEQGSDSGALEVLIVMISEKSVDTLITRESQLASQPMRFSRVRKKNGVEIAHHATRST